tara:strand:- start:2279 stop:2827 length:549 start_codon:yes stop_codon:yes gene_type:complete
MKVLYLSDRDEDMTKMMHLQTRYETVVPSIYSNDFEMLSQKYGDWIFMSQTELEEEMSKCVDVADEAIQGFAPDVIVSSSMGGAVHRLLIEEGLWRGPNVFLASADRQIFSSTQPKNDKSVWIHGREDKKIPPAHSVKAARDSDGTLVLTSDGHTLDSILGSGLIDWAITTAVENSRCMPKD